MDQEIGRSFSQVLARGKYVHSIVFHEVKPDKVDEYVQLVGGWYPKVAKDPKNKVNLVGSWRTEVGDCDTFGKYFVVGCLKLGFVADGVFVSSHLGVSTLPWVPRLFALYPKWRRIPRVRSQAKKLDQLEEGFIDARILVLAYVSTTAARWCV